MPQFLCRAACPVCLAEASQEPVYSRAYDEEPIGPYLRERYPHLPMPELEGRRFTIVKCGACTALYHQEVIEDFYDNQDYKRWDGALFKSKAASRSLRYLAFQSNFAAALLVVLDALRGKPPVPAETEILDHGCGAGEFLMFAKAYGLRASGYDADAAKHPLLREKGVTPLGEEELRRAGRFDIINSNMVFEHLLFPRESFALLAARLRPGGLLRISVPSSKNIEAKILVDANWAVGLKGTAATTNPVWPFGHRNCFTPRSMELLAQSFGLRLIEPETLDGFAAACDRFPLRPLVRLDGQFFFTTG